MLIDGRVIALFELVYQKTWANINVQAIIFSVLVQWNCLQPMRVLILKDMDFVRWFLITLQDDHNLLSALTVWDALFFFLRPG